MNHLVSEGSLKDEINTLLKRKLDGEELDKEPKIQVINQFLHEEIERLQKYANILNNDLPNFTPKLDLLFRDTLEEVCETI